MAKVNLTTRDGIMNEINSIRRASNTLTKRIWTCGIACVKHASSEKFGGYGDPSLLNALANAIPSHMKASFQAWATQVGHVKMGEVVRKNENGEDKRVTELVYDKEKAQQPLPVDKESGKPMMEVKSPEKGTRPQVYNGFDFVNEARKLLNKAREHKSEKFLEKNPAAKTKDNIPDELIVSLSTVLKDFNPVAEEKSELVTGKEADKVRESRKGKDSPAAKAA